MTTITFAAVSAVCRSIPAFPMVAVVVFPADIGVPGYDPSVIALDKLQHLLAWEVQLWDFNIHDEDYSSVGG